MILKVNGNVSPYYVQTLCLLFFPGSKFAMDEKSAPDNPEAEVTFVQTDDLFYATATLSYQGKSITREGRISRTEMPGGSDERLTKIAVGRAVFAAGKDLLDFTPPWGILTGVRPSKVAAELLDSNGTGVLRAKRTLRDEYFVDPKKAALAVAVATNEARLTRHLPISDMCSLYVSIPFCPSRCAYCSFISNTGGRFLSLIDEYLEKLYLDIDNIFSIIKSLGLRLATVYIGGGTPTVLDEKQLATLLSRITSHVDPQTLLEFSLEAGRPDTITEEKLAIARAHGVSRVSVNPQTLSDELLLAVGRRHTVADFYRAYEIAQQSGIRDINVDLIAGLPGDSFANFSQSLDSILQLAPTNLTVHSFSVKNAADIRHREGFSVSAFFVPEAAKSVEYSQLRAQNAHYRPYYMYRQKNTVGNLENVGYAIEGHEAYYNVFMMEELHSVFAVGAAAVTKLVARPSVFTGRDVISRIFTPKYPYEYLRDGARIRTGDKALGIPSLADRITDFYRTHR